MKFSRGSDEKTVSLADDHDAVPVDDPHKSRWERSWPTIACGAGELLAVPLRYRTRTNAYIEKVYSPTAI